MIFLLLFTLVHAAEFNSDLQKIDREMSGNLGVFAKSLSNHQIINYQGSRPWYLASTTKIPVAIAVLRQVEAGKLSLSQKIKLRASDFVDGMGLLLTRKPGEEFTLEFLLRAMLAHSDSTATDILIRLIGKDELNRDFPGFYELTSLLEVRYRAYGEISSKARELTNRDFFSLKTESGRKQRYRKFLKISGEKKPKVPNLDTAFERYYATNANSSSLESFGLLLERLAKGELLNAYHTRLLLQIIEATATGGERLKKGIDKSLRFAHKTGTQVRRLCHAGIVFRERAAEGTVIVVCAEKFREESEAEKAIAEVAKLLTSRKWF